MTKELAVLESGKIAQLDTEKDIFLGSISTRYSRVSYYMHRMKNGKVFYVDEWSAWVKDFNGISLVDEFEAKYDLRRHYSDTCDYEMEDILSLWSDFLNEVD